MAIVTDPVAAFRKSAIRGSEHDTTVPVIPLPFMENSPSFVMPLPKPFPLSTTFSGALFHAIPVSTQVSPVSRPYTLNT